MRNWVGALALAGLATAMMACTAGAQTEAAPQKMSKKMAAAAPAGPAPEHDLSGVWNMHAPPAQRKYIGSTYTAEEPELTPWGEQKYMSAKPSNGPRTHPLSQTDDPVLKQCLPPGTPRIYLQPFPVQFVQTPKETFMFFEYDHTVRQIFTDGRPHPSADDLTPTYMGHSIGHWDDENTLVVDTVGFNDKSWLDRDGHPHSDQLHVVERFHRTDFNNMQIDITMEDPKALAKPWKTTLYFQLKPDWNIEEQDCADNIGFINFEK